jgi:hypothetical protein
VTIRQVVPKAVIDGKLVPLDEKVIHSLAVNAMALAAGAASEQQDAWVASTTAIETALRQLEGNGPLSGELADAARAELAELQRQRTGMVEDNEALEHECEHFAERARNAEAEVTRLRLQALCARLSTR